MFALTNTLPIYLWTGNYDMATTLVEELSELSDKMSAPLWKVAGINLKGILFALTNQPSSAIELITIGIDKLQSTGSTLWLPLALSYLARAYADLTQHDEASRCIAQALALIETTKERWYETEVHRISGETILLSLKQDAEKVEEKFGRALRIARDQCAKSLELRASMSMARLWRDQGKRQQAHDLLAPVYGWFTEGFDTLDLKEAKALLDELAR
jgi:predicted ATPase